MKERSLIAFTLLSQFAVGVFDTLLACFTWFLSFASFAEASRWSAPGFLLVCAGMVAALAVSLFHLGNPRAAWKAVANWRSSWLSREILLAIVFTGIAILFAGIAWSGLPLRRLLVLLGAAGVIVGMGLVYAMARVYCQRSVPAWNTGYTLMDFFLTTLSLGAAAASLLMAIDSTIPSPRLVALEKGLAAWLGLLLLLQIVTLFFWLNPASKSGAYAESLTLLTRRYRPILVVRLSLTSAALLTSGLFIIRPSVNGWPAQTAILGIMGLLVFAAEIFGRSLFYAARVRQGV